MKQRRLIQGLRTPRVCLSLLVVSGLLTACGGGGSKASPTGPTDPSQASAPAPPAPTNTASPSAAPTVSNFRVQPLTPEVSGRQVDYLITATVTDRERDLVGGRVEVLLVDGGQLLSHVIEPTDLIGNSLGVILFLFSPPPGQIRLVFSVVDRAGNRSNEIHFFVTIAASQLPHGSEPGVGGAALGPALPRER